MRIEDIKQEFHKTPEDIRQMIKEKVEEQLCEERVIIMEKNTKRRTFRFPKAAAIADDTYVVSSEMLSFDGHDGVYLEKELGDETEIVFDKRIYLFYPEFHRALIMEIANNVTKEEALKVAEHLELVDTGKYSGRSGF